MSGLEGIVRSAEANTPFDVETQRLLAYEPRKDRFVEPGRFAPFARREHWLVTGHHDPEALVEGVMDWHLSGAGVSIALRTHFRLACAAGHEETFVRAWVLEGTGDVRARVEGILRTAAAALDDAALVPAWCEALAEAAVREAGARGALLGSETTVLESDGGALWGLVAFAPQGATEHRDVEVELRYTSAPAAARLRDLLEHDPTNLRAQLRTFLPEALGAHLGPDDPISRLSVSGRAVRKDVERLIRDYGMALDQFRMSPATIERPVPSEVEVGESDRPMVPSAAEPRGGRLASLSRRLEETIAAVAPDPADPRRLVTLALHHPTVVVAGRPETVIAFVHPAVAAEGRLQPGTPITLLLEVDDGPATVDPSVAEAHWEGHELRFTFDICVESQPVRLGASLQVAGIEIARVAMGALAVAERADGVDARARTAAIAHGRLFVSSAPDDVEVVESLAIVRKAIGDDALIDVTALRKSTDRRGAVREALDQADVFQLVWSDAAATSSVCGFEWRRALKVASVRAGFVRVSGLGVPPPVPPELESLPVRPWLGR